MHPTARRPSVVSLSGLWAPPSYDSGIGGRYTQHHHWGTSPTHQHKHSRAWDANTPVLPRSIGHHHSTPARSNNGGVSASQDTLPDRRATGGLTISSPSSNPRFGVVASTSSSAGSLHTLAEAVCALEGKGSLLEFLSPSCGPAQDAVKACEHSGKETCMCALDSFRLPESAAPATMAPVSVSLRGRDS